MKLRWPAWTALLCCTPAHAHSFGKLYNLPVPLWMYLYGAAAALVLSFLIVGYFISGGAAARNERSVDLEPYRWVRFLRSARMRRVLRALSVFGLCLTIACGLFGSGNPYSNLSMTFFWIVFVLGFAYLTALTGNIFEFINPWRVIAECFPRLLRGRYPYPARLAYYPALLLYFLFIWVELFGRTRPFSLALILLAYSAINFFGAWLWGIEAWFRHGEFFGVFFRLIGLMSPVAADARGMRLRQPFIGLLQEHPGHISLLLFVLFMLSSTAFDGLRDTLPWVKIFWKDIYPKLLAHTGGDMVQSYPMFQKLYAVYQTLALLLSPYLYLLFYLGCIALMRRLAGSAVPVCELALRFAYTLIPIAFVYNLTHYYTLIETQGPEIFRLLSDPLGRGWNLFGTARWSLRIIPDAGVVWHTQVWLILLGHIVSVYLAHLEALKVFPTQRQAVLSQWPMLMLMVAFTAIGLWILSLPIAGNAMPAA